jgi:hypothetical protein
VSAADNTVSVYSLNQILTGQVNALWTQPSLGPASNRLGSNITPPPIGICSTPVADRSIRTLYVMALVQQSAGDAYIIFALDLNDGNVNGRASLTDPGGLDRPTFDPMTQDQRGALNLVNGWIYATFAAFLGGDEELSAPYHGWVVACNQHDLSQQLFLSTTKNVIGGGCWGPGGAAAAPDGTLYVSTGNAAADDAYWANLPSGQHPGDVGDYFEGVIRVQLTAGPGLKVIDWYQPSWAQKLNTGDLDFGGSSPLVLPTIKGHQLVVTGAKDGNVYLLDGRLSGWGAELWSSVQTPGAQGDLFDLECNCAPAYYRDPSTDNHYVYVVGHGQPGLIAFLVDVSGAAPRLSQVWKAGMGFGDQPGSPIITVDPATQKALVWAVAGVAGVPLVLAFDALSGEVVFRSDSLSGNDVGDFPTFAHIIADGNSVLVGTNSGVVVYVNAPSLPPSNWAGTDITAIAEGGPTPNAAGDPNSLVFEAQGTGHVFFRGVDGHIHELWFDIRWHHNDLNQLAVGAPDAAGDPSSLFFVAQNTGHIFYRGVDGHIHELWWETVHGWHHNDLNQLAVGAPDATGDPDNLVVHNTGHVFYTAIDDHIHQLWFDVGWHHNDPTAIAAGTPNATGKPSSFSFVAHQSAQVFFRSMAGDIYQLRWE